MVPAPPYQPLHNDIEEGIPLGGSEDQLDAHSTFFIGKLYSLSSSLSTSPSSLLSHYYSSFQQVAHWRKPFLLALCLLVTSSAILAAWSVPTDIVARTLGNPSFSPSTSSKPGTPGQYQLWPPADANESYSVRYALIPFFPEASSPRITFGPQSPPQNIPYGALDALFDPSSLSHEAPSGLQLPPDIEAFFNRPTKFDVVWTWVNGSDPLHRQALAEAERLVLIRRKRAMEKRSGEPIVEPNVAEIEAAVSARASVAPKLYRDHDELRYSLRSVLQYFGPHIDRFHVVAGDFADPRRRNSGPANNSAEHGVLVAAGGKPPLHSATASSFPVAGGKQSRRSAQPQTETAIYRFGQIPQWLKDDVDVMDLSPNRGAGPVALAFHHHSQFFAEYREPTFNSFAIEAQMSRIQGIAEHFIYMNDDYFFYDTVQPADFYTPAYGIVLRLQPDLLVTSANPSHEDKHGEWRPLQYSNWLLDERYGARARPYMVHAPKSISLSLFRELGSFRNFEHTSPSGEPEEATMGGVFRDALLTTGKHIFRGQYSLAKGHDDAYVTFLFAHHVVERWREILLWSWVVGRIGGDNGEWTTDLHRTRAWTELGGVKPDPVGLVQEPQVKVGLSLRETLDHDTVLDVLGSQSATTYSFSALDGYPYAFLGAKGSPSWPQMTDKSPHSRLTGGYRLGVAGCQISLDFCFPTGLNRTSEIFKHVAFENPECGDCIIRQLVISSGKKGLEAFLPHAHRVAEFAIARSPPSTADRRGGGDRDPFLPLASSWKQIDFSLESVLAPWVRYNAETTEARAAEPEGRDGGHGAAQQLRRSGVNVREWAMRAMARYRFVLGETPFAFVMLRSATMTASQLRDIGRMVPRPAMVCINDDLRASRYAIGGTLASASRVFKDWMEGTWGNKSRWER